MAGPLEAVVNNLTREIQGKGEEGRQLQRRWVGWQTELVELQAENNRLAQDLQRLKASHTITHHKRTRLRQQYAPPALPCPALPCPALPCPACRACPALPCPACRACPALPCLSCPACPACPALPCLPCPACPVLPCPALPCPALPCPHALQDICRSHALLLLFITVC